MPRRSSTAASASYAPSVRSALLQDESGLRPEPSLTRGICCEGCGSDRVTRISMTLTDGTPVDFTSCHVCEHRTWRESAGDVLALDGVLKRTRKTR
jgi:hypothetical protein